MQEPVGLEIGNERNVELCIVVHSWLPLLVVFTKILAALFASVIAVGLPNTMFKRNVTRSVLDPPDSAYLSGRVNKPTSDGSNFKRSKVSPRLNIHV